MILVQGSGGENPTAPYNNLSSHLYQNRRHRNPLSTSSFGKKAPTNWCGVPLSQVKVACYGMEHNNDKIRRLLKKTFYTQNYQSL